MKTFSVKKYSRSTFFLLTIFICIIFIGANISCTKKKEVIKIGIATTLTGPASTSGIHARNATLLAVEQINASGGVNGHPIELVIKDDKGMANEAVIVDKELINEGVAVVIGHYLSTLTVKTVPLFNEKKVLMISTGSTTSGLSDKEDFFLRMMVPDDKRAALTADLAINKLGIKKMAVIYDLSNPKYTEPFSEHFRNQFEQKGGEITASIPFNSLEKYSATDIAGETITSGADGVFLITNAINGARLCQRLRKIDPHIMITASAWTFPDPDFIRDGGKSVEGVTCLVEFDQDATNAKFLGFKSLYKKRFDDDIGINAYIAYEITQILFETFSKTDDIRKIKDKILKQSTFQGLTDLITINKYGDPSRPLYIQEIKGAKVITTGKVEGEIN